MKKVIYCFSGAGNSLRAARLIAKELGGATIVSVKKGIESDLAADADVVGFLCPVYEWDIPETMKDFAEKLTVSKNAYTFMVAAYVAVHGRCFETMDAILREKGTRLHYGKPLCCVASQCIAYEPFPAPKLMVPYSDARAKKLGKQIAARKAHPVSQPLYYRKGHYFRHGRNPGLTYRFILQQVKHGKARKNRLAVFYCSHRDNFIRACIWWQA